MKIGIKTGMSYIINPYTYASIESLDETGYNHYGRPNAVSNGTKYWIGGVKDSTPHITEVESSTGAYTAYQVDTVPSADNDHNHPQVLVRASDNKLITAYCAQNDTQLYIKVSTNALDASSWGSATNVTDGSRLISYPSPFQASNGDIFIFFRSRSGTDAPWKYIKSTDNGSTWGTPVDFFNSSSGSYTHYLMPYQNGDEIHFLGTFGNVEIRGNLLPYHFVFDISTETAEDSHGASITLPVTESDATPIYNNVVGDQTCSICDIITKDNVPRVLFVYFPNGDLADSERFKDRFIYFSDYVDGAWTSRILYKELTGAIAEQFGTPVSAPSHSGVPRFCVQNEDLIFAPKKPNEFVENTSERTEIFTYDLTTDVMTQITFNSTNDNWRPLSVNVANLNLVWAENILYNSLADMEMRLKATTVSTTTGGTSIAELYDDVSAMYTLRRPDMRILWTNAVIKLRRSSDNATAFVFFDGDEVGDTITTSSLISTSSNTTPGATTLGTWIGSDNGFVEQWFGITADNTINGGKRPLQLTNSQQPQFISSGAILTKNGKPTIDFLTTTTGILSDTIPNKDLDSSNNWSIVTVTYNDSAGDVGSFFGTDDVDTKNLRLYSSRSTSLRIAQYVNGSSTVYTTDLLAQQDNADQKLLTTTLNSGTMKSYYNGTLQDTVVTTGDYVNGSLEIGRRFSTNCLDGGIQEIIIFPSDKTSDLSDVHSDVNSYYSIY